jgi:hypothetical protein
LLNYAEVERRSRPLFGSLPPSRITTLAVVLNGELSFEDSTGRRGEVAAVAEQHDLLPQSPLARL